MKQSQTRRNAWKQATLLSFLCLACAALPHGTALGEEAPVGAPPVASPQGSSPSSGATSGGAATNGGSARVPSQREQAAILSAVAAGQQVLRLSVADVVRMGAEANLGVLSASFEAPIAREGMIAADANFDTLLTASFDAARNETPVTNVFQGNGLLVEKTVAMRGGVTKNLRSGGRASLLYRADRLSTNSPFFLLNPSWIQGVVLEASQPLLRGAGDVALADIRRAQNSIVSARAGYDTQVQDTLLKIIRDYWELVFSEIALDARVQAEDVARDLLTDAEARLAAEVGTPLDVAEARAGVERRVSEVLGAENLRASVQDQLLASIIPFGAGTARNLLIVPTDGVHFSYATLPTAAEEDRYVRLALAGRPELRGQRADIATRGVDVLVAHNAIRPQLDVRGSIGPAGLGAGYAGSFSNMVDAQAVSGSIGLEFSLFLGQRAARANWLSAAWRRRQARIAYREIENLIIVQVRSALRDIQTARGQVSAGRAQVKAKTEDVAGERLRLDQGKSTPFNVLLKVNDLTEAQTSLGRAAADVRLSESRLWHSVGSLVARLEVDVERWQPCPECR